MSESTTIATTPASEAIETDELVQPTASDLRARRTLRGMVTVEYAMGIVMVIALVGVIILAINSGQFQGLVNQFIDFIIKFLQTSIK